jgi:NitT/TauT family transport system substrate-binding protein
VKSRPRALTRVLSVLASVAVLVGVAATVPACTKPSAKKIVIGFSAWPGWFPWEVAAQQKLFAKHGVTVEMKYFDSYTDSINALATGAIDANAQTLNDTLASVSGGAKQTIVLVNDNSTGNDKIIARDGINSIADLKGKKVAVEQFTVDHYLLLLALEQAGMTEKDIQLVPLVTDKAAAAFAAGQVDAVGAFQPFADTALARAGSKAIATSAEFPGAIPDHLAVKPSLIKDRPKDVQAIVDTWFDTLKWIKANKDAAYDIMAKRAGVSATDYKAYDSGTTIFTRLQNLDAFTPGTTAAHLNFQANKIADFMVSTSMVPTRPSLDGLFDERFVKASPE